MRDEKFIKWGYIVGQEILFDNNIVLKIISYDAKSQKIYFKYNNEISCCESSYFIEFDSQKILDYFRVLKYKYEIGEYIIDKRRNLLIIDRFLYNKKKLYKVQCNICGYICIVDEYSLKEHNYSCKCCYGNIVIQGVNDIPTTDPWMVDYFQGGYDEAKLYTKGSNAQIYFKCPFCNIIQDKSTPIYQLSGTHRLNCSCMDSVSYPEKLMRSFLQINDINYLYHVGNSIFNWCKRYIYDFYIPDKNIIIETHGEQHYTRAFRKSISLEEQKRIDLEKKMLAENNGFIYIIIDCRKSDANFIFNNIKDSGLIDLLNININKINLKTIDSECQKKYNKRSL